MDWQPLRDQCPVTAHWAFLDHAAVAPPPAPCADAIAAWAHDKSIHGISSYWPWAQRVEEARRRAGQLLNADPLDVCFVTSTTHGIGIVAEGFPWQAGDNVVIVAEEYPSNQYPWMNQRDRGVEARAVASRGSRVDLADIRDAMDARTRVLAISSVEFASGFHNDLAALGELCRQRGVFFFVDAIQSLGVFPLDVQQLPIDALAADSHKWLLGPEGAGIAYIRREWVDRLHATGVGWNSVVNPTDFSTINFRMKPHAGRWEGGTVNAGAIAGMGESLRLLLDAGIANVQARVLELTDYLCDRVRSAGCEVFSSRAAGEASGIVSLLTPGRDPKELMKRCKAAGVIVNVRGGRLRVSPHAYNTVGEIDRFIDAIRPRNTVNGGGTMSQLSSRCAVYTGVFDPIHLGHLDIIQRTSRIVDELIVGVGNNPEKTTFFSVEERVALVRKVVVSYPNVSVQPFPGLAVHFVREMGARIMVRGLRTLSDMEYEFTMSLMNLNLDPEIETVFLMANEEFSHVSSTFLRQIAALGGDLTKFLPAVVRQALVDRAKARHLPPPDIERGA